MELISKVRSYLLETEFSLHCYENQLDIVNYKEIGRISDTSISILTDQHQVEIEGKNLTIIKLLEDEVLIKGTFQKIEFR
ncbi:MAG: YabP/YqfC family sporulation protein [Firmicutes bacterium]|nr:YabP/YqfC family sporulation protein [Bacillota bacterium]